MFRRKSGRLLVRPLVLMARLVAGKLESSWARAAAVFAFSVYALYKTRGLSWVVKYLKGCQVLLMQSAVGQRLATTIGLNVFVSRTNRGIPRIIPVVHRHGIRSGNTKILKFWVTLFSLYRVLEIPGKLKLSTITDPGRFDPIWVRSLSEFVPLFLELLSKFRGSNLDEFRSIKDAWNVSNRAPILEAVPYMINRSAPTSAGVDRITLVNAQGEVDKDHAIVVTAFGPTLRKVSSRLFSTWYPSLIKAACIWELYPEMWRTLNEWCYATGNGKLIRMMILLQSAGEGTNYKGYLGSLGIKEEAAGKVRVFAMVDPFTQWVMKPLHDLIFSLLRVIPQDGTFDQTQPLNNLISLARKNKNHIFYSYDLSAATDRLPIILQEEILNKMIGPKLTKLWARLLVGRGYYLHHDKYCPSGQLLTYAVGQPMGAKSSWAMLALTHHFIIQIAAFMVTNERTWFTDYAVLGDDVVIAHKDVATKYLELMDKLGVDIGLAKSLIGNGFEFAKRYYYQGEDCSPIAFKELDIASRSFSNGIELAKRHSLTIGAFLSLMGIGPFAKTRIYNDFSKMSMRLRNYLMVYYSPNGVVPMEVKEWLCSRSLNTIVDVPDQHFSTFFTEWCNKYIKALQPRLVAIDSQVSGFNRLMPGAGFDRRPWVPLEMESTFPGYGWASYRELVPRFNFDDPLRWIEVLFQRELVAEWYQKFYELLDKRDALVTKVRQHGPGINWDDFLVVYHALVDLERDLHGIKTPDLPASYVELKDNTPEVVSKWISLHVDINRALVQYSWKAKEGIKNKPVIR